EPGGPPKPPLIRRACASTARPRSSRRTPAASSSRGRTTRRAQSLEDMRGKVPQVGARAPPAARVGHWGYAVLHHPSRPPLPPPRHPRAARRARDLPARPVARGHGGAPRRHGLLLGRRAHLLAAARGGDDGRRPHGWLDPPHAHPLDTYRSLL